MNSSDITKHLKSLHYLSTKNYHSENQIFEEYLSIGKKIFNLETGVINQIKNDIYTVLFSSSPLREISKNTHLLDEAYCYEIFKHGKSVGFNHDQSEKKSSFSDNMKPESYLRTPILVNGNVFGVLNFSDRKICIEEFKPEHFDIIEIMAQDLGNFIEAKLLKNLLEEEGLKNNRKISLLGGIQENAAHALISTTIDGVITSFNKAAENMLGYLSEELIGKETPAKFHDLEEVVKYSEVFSKELGIKVEPGFSTFTCYTDQGRKNQFEWSYIHKDGTRIPVLLSITAIFNTEGNKIGYLGIAQDVSEIRGIEKKLEKRNEELAQFAYRTSHDLKSPLISIRGLAGFIEEDLENGDIKEAKDNLKKIISSSLKLETLVIDILNLTKAELEEETLENININGLLADLHKNYEFLLKEKNVDLVFETIDAPLIYSQKLRLQQILENLLANSIKYCDFKKDKMFCKISFEVGDKILIRVCDNGVGIPKEKQSDLFKMFARFHPDLAEGSGLGMSIVEKNVASLEGEISFVSSEDGTRFKIKLPIKKKI